MRFCISKLSSLKPFASSCSLTFWLNSLIFSCNCCLASLIKSSILAYSSGITYLKARSSSIFFIAEIPSLWAIGAYTTSVSSAMRFCLSGRRTSSVSILCKRSHSLINSTLTSSMLANSILRKLIAEAVSFSFELELTSSSLRIATILVSPFTSEQTSLPKSKVSCSSSHSVSSTTSCKSAAISILSSPPICATNEVTKIGCML